MREWQVLTDAAISLALDFCVVLVIEVLERNPKAFHAGQGSIPAKPHFCPLPWGFCCSTARSHSPPPSLPGEFSIPSSRHLNFVNLSLQLLSCLLNSRKEILNNRIIHPKASQMLGKFLFPNFFGETRLPGSIKGGRDLSRSQLGGTHRTPLTPNLTLKITAVSWELGSGLGGACRTRAGSGISPKMEHSGP